MSLVPYLRPNYWRQNQKPSNQHHFLSAWRVAWHVLWLLTGQPTPPRDHLISWMSKTPTRENVLDSLGPWKMLAWKRCWNVCNLRYQRGLICNYSIYLDLRMSTQLGKPKNAWEFWELVDNSHGFSIETEFQTVLAIGWNKLGALGHPLVSTSPQTSPRWLHFLPIISSFFYQPNWAFASIDLNEIYLNILDHL